MGRLAPDGQSGVTAPVRTLIVLGSGGHTAEMLALVGQLDREKYSPRTYVVASTDRMGAQKAQSAEQGQGQPASSSARVLILPRSREVGQSYITSVWTTLVALWTAFAIVYQERPQLILVNGPGTCIPICAAAHFLRLFRWHTRVVYVESIARVASLSLSGKILYYTHMADAFFVQWPDLQRRFPRSKFKGRLF